MDDDDTHWENSEFYTTLQCFTRSSSDDFCYTVLKALIEGCVQYRTKGSAPQGAAHYSLLMNMQ